MSRDVRNFTRNPTFRLPGIVPLSQNIFSQLSGPHSVALSAVLHISGLSLEWNIVGIKYLTAIKHTVKLFICQLVFYVQLDTHMFIQ
jgi:hypothetical protein